MSRTKPGSTGVGVARDDTFERTTVGLRKLIERVGPWLLDLGNWIFGALIAFNLLILTALLTVGPVDAAVVVATASIALALPPAVGGFFLLRLMADIKNVDLEEAATQAFQEAGFSVEEQGRPSGSPESIAKRRTRIVLAYSYGLLAWTLLVTIVGVTAAMWHMGWWIGVTFVVMAIASPSIIVGALAQFGSETTLRAPASADKRPTDQADPRHI